MLFIFVSLPIIVYCVQASWHVSSHDCSMCPNYPWWSPTIKPTTPAIIGMMN